MEQDSLIYGKSNLTRVVGLEPKDDQTEVFIQEENGDVSRLFIPHRYWMLSNTRLDANFIRLKGNLHYKYGRQFSTKEDCMKFRNIYKHKDVFCIYNDKEAQMVKDGIVYYSGLSPKDIGILSFDIETTGLDPDAPDAKVLLISTTFRNSTKLVKRLFAYDDYPDEGAMIAHFCEYVREIDPSVILGHNIICFDLPYLESRAVYYDYLGLKLGRNDSYMNRSPKDSSFRVDGSRDLPYRRLTIYGREVIDTMFLAYKYDFSRKYETYGLKQIIKQENLEKPNRVFYDASQIRYKYKDPVEWKKIKEYCIDDSDDTLSLYDLMIPAQFYWTQTVPKGFQEVINGATGSQLNSIMIRSYLQQGHSIPKASVNDKGFPGAISLGIPGVYNNTIRWDIASLYPSIILTYNIYDKEKDPQGNFLKIMKILTEERLKNKKLGKETGLSYYKDLEQSQKIGINSGYGYLGAPGLNFNSFHNAELITDYGRKILLKGINWATGKSDEEIGNLLSH